MFHLQWISKKIIYKLSVFNIYLCSKMCKKKSQMFFQQIALKKCLRLNSNITYHQYLVSRMTDSLIFLHICWHLIAWCFLKTKQGFVEKGIIAFEVDNWKYLSLSEQNLWSSRDFPILSSSDAKEMISLWSSSERKMYKN